ncbi:MAG: hypothetical protein ACREKS_20660 [Candidatus Rokuibacteriota bacterium]
MPAEHLGMTAPDRDRSVRQLAYHIFRLSLAFREAMVERRLPEVWLVEEAPAGLGDGAALAGYGDGVRAQLADWFGRADACDGTVATYYGVQTAHQLLERTTWHAAQHVRQLHGLLGRMGVTPDDPLTDADVSGLPLPQEIW